MAKEERPIIGLVEEVIIGSEDEGKYKARIDTGATKSSIDSVLAAKLRLGPVIKTKLVKSAHGNSIRPMVKVEVILAGKKCKRFFTIADRSHMKYKILIGQNILKKGYLIDPSK